MPGIGLWGTMIICVIGIFSLAQWIFGTLNLSPWIAVMAVVLEIPLLLGICNKLLNQEKKKWQSQEDLKEDPYYFDDKLLLEYLPLAVLSVDREGNIKHSNAKAREITGISQETGGSGNIYNLSHDPDNPLALLKQTLEDKRIYREHNFTCYLDGETKYYRLNTFTITGVQEQPAGALLTGCSISEQLLQEGQLSQRGKLAMIGELAAGTAHEIRNPLTSVRGLIQVLGKRFPKGDQALEHVKMMLTEIDRINYIIKELLLLARRTSPNLSFASLPAIIDDVLVLLEGQAHCKGINILREYNNQLPLVILDEDQMKQVFLNLATNAIYAMPEGGLLTISASFLQQEEIIEVKFKDTGMGIVKENMSRIFHPFFTTRAEGTGLGLPVSYQIVDNHGGKLSVESIPGSGSTFTVKIPLVNCEKQKPLSS